MLSVKNFSASALINNYENDTCEMMLQSALRRSSRRRQKSVPVRKSGGVSGLGAGLKMRQIDLRIVELEECEESIHIHGFREAAKRENNLSRHRPRCLNLDGLRHNPRPGIDVRRINVLSLRVRGDNTSRVQLRRLLLIWRCDRGIRWMRAW